jgi:hypothetical protein
MTDAPIEVDYLLIGAGAVNMAFADSMLSDSTATMAIVDRHHRPGGHWNDAYPFVRLHQPSQFYGVNSRHLGSGTKDATGPNAGYYELASGQEVLSHFDLVMQQRFLPSGRVHYFPMSDLSEADGGGMVTSLLSGEQRAIKANKVVDGTHSQMQIPSRRKPAYRVGEGVICIPPNDLPRVASAHSSYVVVGAGKTGMDTCTWLLANGANPESICWIMPRDSWLLNRECFQPGPEFLERGAKDLADQVEALANAETVSDVFRKLEECESIFRIDPAVEPGAYHCAVISRGELEQLRRIRNIVRMGHVREIERDRMVLDDGTVPAADDALYIDCSAAGIPSRPTKPVFEGNRITLQWIRLCQPTFSAALIGHIEATIEDEAEKNRLCTPIAPPTVPVDWIRMMATEIPNEVLWSQTPEIARWMASSRLNPFTALLQKLTGDETETLAHLQRYEANIRPAMAKAHQFLAA